MLDYEQFYGEDGMEEFMSICDHTIDTHVCHGGLVLRNTTLLKFKKQMKEQHGEITWYNEALGDLGVDVTPRNEKTATQLSAYKLNNTKPKTNKRPTAYQSTNKSYRECLNVAKTEEDIDIINSALTQARGKIMMKNSRGKGVDTNKGMVKDFPAIEPKPTEKRKAPPGSPTRRKNPHC